MGIVVASGGGEGTLGLAYTLNSNNQSYSCSGIGTATETDIEIGSIHDGLPVTAIAALAFKGNTTITSVSIPSSVRVIRDRAFLSCSNLVAVSLSVGLTSIESEAFAATHIARIIIPEGMTGIGYAAFRNINDIRSVLPSTLEWLAGVSYGGTLFARWYFKSANPPSIQTDTFANYATWGTNIGLFYVPYANINDYKTATNWASYASLINPLVNTVADLSTIDTTAYTKACVVGNEEYIEYTYDGSSWNIVN